MFGLISVVGGAAALEIRRLRNRGHGENDAQVQELKKTVEQYAKDLERERRTASGASRRASGLEAETEALRRDAHSLRQEADTLGRQREELAQQNTLLLLNNLALGTKAQKLQNEANELALANRRLTDQVEELGRDRDADAARFASDLAALRDRVAEVLQRLFRNVIDEPAAVEALRELGCEVRFVPNMGARDAARHSEAPSYVFEPRLLLDDPAKMARLVQAAASAQSGSSTPQLLEGPSATTASGGLTPHVGRDVPAPRTMQAALTIGSSGSSSGSGTPRFMLSWLGSGAEGATASASSDTSITAVNQAGERLKDVGSTNADKAADVHAKAAAGGSVKSGGLSKSCGQVDQQGGTLVFSPQTKGASGKSRLGFSLTGATTAVFGGGKKASGAPMQPDFDSLPGSFDHGGDVTGSRDLMTRD